MTNNDFLLSVKDTNVLKGIGLLLLLCHHLFYVQKGLYDDIHLVGNHYLVQELGIWCKVCVAIFVFLSGYGLTVGAIKTRFINVRSFYWHRFTKLLLNYWLIWVLFVPISILVFGRTFTDAYQTNIIPKLILDFFGIINCFGLYGYNATWWFYSCIIVLYLVFPWLYKLMEANIWVLVASIVAIYFMPIPQTIGIRIYFACFVMGMSLSRYKKSTPPSSVLWFSLFSILSVERFVAKDVFLFDSVLTLSMVMAYKSIKLPDLISNLLEFVGKHSMNIFLFHTFIYYYWFRDFIYASRNPIVIYLQLLIICLLISVGIELLKKIIRFNIMVNHIDKLYGIR